MHNITQVSSQQPETRLALENRVMRTFYLNKTSFRVLHGENQTGTGGAFKLTMAGHTGSTESEDR